MEPRPRRTRTKQQAAHLTPVQKGEVSKIARSIAIKQLEKKYTYAGISGATTAAYVFTSMTDIPVGTTDSNRIGDSVKILGFRCYLTIEEALPNLLSAHYVRCVIFQFAPQFSVTPPTAANTHLIDPISGAAVTHRSEWTVDGRSQIRVLWEKDYVVAGNLTSGGTPAYLDHWTLNLSSAKKSIQFVAGSTTDGLDKIFFGIIASSGTTPPNFNFVFKMDFTDA